AALTSRSDREGDPMPTAAHAPHIRRFSKAQYRQMQNLGWFAGVRVELVGGEVVELPPAGRDHDDAVEAAAAAARRAFRSGCAAPAGRPLALGAPSEPLPDIAVVAGWFRVLDAAPAEALVVIEVADATLAYDRGRKASLYASAGVPEYRVIDLAGRRVEVCR